MSANSPAMIEQIFGVTPETVFLMGSLGSLVPVESALMIDPRGHSGLEGLPDAPGRLCRRDVESSLCAERLFACYIQMKFDECSVHDTTS